MFKNHAIMVDLVKKNNESGRDKDFYGETDLAKIDIYEEIFIRQSENVAKGVVKVYAAIVGINTLSKIAVILAKKI